MPIPSTKMGCHWQIPWVSLWWHLWPKIDAVSQCWVASLVNYNFWQHHKSGKSNVEVDALSRIPWDSDTSYYVSLDNLAVKAIIEGHTSGAPLFQACVRHAVTARIIHAITIGATLIDSENSLISYKTGLKVPVKMSKEQLIEEHNRDPHITEIQKLIKQKKFHQQKNNKEDTLELHSMLRHKYNFVLRNGLLGKKVQTTQRDQPSFPFVFLQNVKNRLCRLAIMPWVT